MGNFNNLETVKFQQKMRVAAANIYTEIFPGCCIEDLRDGDNVHVLDKSFGIDSLIRLSDGQFITLQEKYRNNYYLRFGDFTQEYKNAYGTDNESDGEWFNLTAQLYFYGWANKGNTVFEKWLIMDILRYKILMSRCGGIEKVGKPKDNDYHGRARFYTIDLNVLEPAILYKNY